MGFEQDKLTMSSFIKSQFSYCPLMCFAQEPQWIRWIRSTKNAYALLQVSDANFKELLESSHELSIRKTCIDYLIIEVFTWAISRINHWHFYSLEKSLQHTQYLFIWSARFRVDATAFCASQLWQKVPIAIKDSSSL